MFGDAVAQWWSSESLKFVDWGSSPHGIAKIFQYFLHLYMKLSKIIAGLEKKLKVADIDDDPAKWKKYWDTLVGDVEHKHTKCFNKIKTHMTEDQAHGLCNKLKQKYG